MYLFSGSVAFTSLDLSKDFCPQMFVQPSKRFSGISIIGSLVPKVLFFCFGMERGIGIHPADKLPGQHRSFKVERSFPDYFHQRGGFSSEKNATGTFVILDQFIDRAFARDEPFFGPSPVAHVSMAQPVCSRMGNHLKSSAKKLGIAYVRGGTNLAIEGPQFSTFAKSNLYCSCGCDVICIIIMQDAKLAREAELCYATIAVVTDYDCWHPEYDQALKWTCK